MTRDIPAQFATAGLSLIVEREPIDPGRGLRAVEIVQLDIARRSGREWFRLFPGHRGNRIQVDAVDAAQRQAVLTVQETARAYEARVEKPTADAVVLRRDGDATIVEMYSRGTPQHYLCGQDEAHLFIAQLPRWASSVRMAHELLRPWVPEDYARQRSVRQGEWFFFEATHADADECVRLDRLGYGKRAHVGIAEGAKWIATGRPHVASELRVLKGTQAQPGRRVFVRGEVRHPDHATLRLEIWHRVFQNRERATRQRGVLWID